MSSNLEIKEMLRDLQTELFRVGSKADRTDESVDGLKTK